MKMLPKTKRVVIYDSLSSLDSIIIGRHRNDTFSKKAEFTSPRDYGRFTKPAGKRQNLLR